MDSEVQTIPYVPESMDQERCPRQGQFFRMSESDILGDIESKTYERVKPSGAMFLFTMLMFATGPRAFVPRYDIRRVSAPVSAEVAAGE